MRNVVLGLDAACAAPGDRSRIRRPRCARPCPGLARAACSSAADTLPSRSCALGPSSQSIFSALRPWIAAQVLLRDDRDAAQRPELGRRWRALDLDHLDDAGHLERSAASKLSDLAAVAPADAQPRRRACRRARCRCRTAPCRSRCPAVDQLHLGLADVAELSTGPSAAAESRAGTVRRAAASASGAISEAAAGRPMYDLVVPRLDFGHGDVPSRRRRPARASGAPRRRSGASARRNDACCASRRCPGCRTAPRRRAPARRARGSSRLRARRRRSWASSCARLAPSRSGGR